MREQGLFSPMRLQTEQERPFLLRVPRPIPVTQIQSTTTTIVTARDDADFQIQGFEAGNQTAGASTLTLHIVESGGSASASNKIFAALSIAANSRLTVFDRERVCWLSPGESLVALCATNDDINVFGHGFDYQGEYGR